MSSNARPTAGGAGHLPAVITITHPFHPRSGQTIDVFLRSGRWGDELVFYRCEHGYSASIPTSWTSLQPHDPFVVVAAGRARFRTVDLLELAAMISEVRP